MELEWGRKGKKLTRKILTCLQGFFFQTSEWCFLSGKVIYAFEFLFHQEIFKTKCCILLKAEENPSRIVFLPTISVFKVRPRITFFFITPLQRRRRSFGNFLCSVCGHRPHQGRVCRWHLPDRQGDEASKATGHPCIGKSYKHTTVKLEFFASN